MSGPDSLQMMVHHWGALRSRDSPNSISLYGKALGVFGILDYALNAGSGVKVEDALHGVRATIGTCPGRLR